MRVVISGIAVATPPGSATQDQALDLMTRAARLEGESLRFARAIFDRSGIERRGSVLCDRAGDQSFYPAAGPAPGTADRMAMFVRYAVPLAERACRDALRAARCAPADVTHVVTASCTGFCAPGVDIELVERLALPPDVRRVHVGFMGCHAAINALDVARSIVLAAARRDRPARVLVACVELSSIHLQPSSRPDHIIAGALFADGAAACVVSGEPDAAADTPAPCTLELLDTASTVVPGSRDAMAWSIGDHGFAMTLAEGVPGLVREHLRPWLTSWLARPPAEYAWCVHPGGPRILDAVTDAMGLSPGAMRFSREVLRDHGNMSSVTILFILDRMLQEAVRAPVVMLAFGPGLSLEAALAAPR